VETIRDQLEFYRTQRPRFVERYFPLIAERGYVEHSDVDVLTSQQAEAVRYMMVSSIMYGKGRVAKERARAVSFASEEIDDPDDRNTCSTPWSLRVRLLEEALDDLCRVFGLPTMA
jgi:hypothetical protein